MTCEPEPVRLSWEIQQYEPSSRVWLCKGYGRATTTADPSDIAAAVLAGYLAATPPRYGETIRTICRPDGGTAVTVTPADLDDDAVATDPDVLRALPLYLRDALPA